MNTHIDKKMLSRIQTWLTNPETVPCGAATNCRLARYCTKLSYFKGKCPDVDYPYEDLYTPSGCLTNISALTCNKVLLTCLIK